MKEIKNYIVLVDNGKPIQFRHNTAGRYRVGAKSESEAKKLVQDKIKFGNVQVYYQCTGESPDKMIGYKQIYKEMGGENMPARSAIEPMNI